MRLIAIRKRGVTPRLSGSTYAAATLAASAYTEPGRRADALRQLGTARAEGEVDEEHADKVRTAACAASDA